LINDTTCLRIKVEEEKIEREQKELSLQEDMFTKKGKFFSLLGSDVRLKIIYLLLKNEKLCVCDLSDMLQMKQSPVSQHLRKLKDSELLISKREGLMINYYINITYRKDLASFLAL